MENPTLITFLVEEQQALEMAEQYKHLPRSLVDLDARQIQDPSYMTGIGYFIGHKFLTFFLKYYMAAKTNGKKPVGRPPLKEKGAFNA